MCCLFGLIDYHRSLSAKQKNHILSILAAACEVRGTDATGIAYNSQGKLQIYKRPVPGHQLRFCVPDDAWTVMGHTRMATQGSAVKNRNNHPFPGHIRDGAFALAHNGVISNDRKLRRSLSLPRTKIKTDSYIAVQLLEEENALNFNSLKAMAEQVEGSFTFTVLSQHNRLFIVKGDNPLCLYRFSSLGLYVYASTKDILMRALAQLHLSIKQAEPITISCGEILCIDPSGKIARDHFDDSKLPWGLYGPLQACCTWEPNSPPPPRLCIPGSYLEEIKSVASSFGYAPEDIDRLAAMGFSPEELEEFLYCGEL